MNVLVVGGAGYVGSLCGAHLRAAGDDVVVLDDLTAGHREACPGPLIEGDVRDRALVAGVLREGRFDAVLHFAARAVVGDSMAHPAETFSVNVGGTLALLDAMSSAGVRCLVFSSSCAVYGEPRNVPITEDHPFAPVSPYGESKAVAERILDLAREREGLRITALRYFNAAGAAPDASRGESHDPETHLVPLALRALRDGRELPVFGTDWPTRDGTCVRDYVHVLDLADAHRRALRALVDGASGGAYNLGTGGGTTVHEVFAAIERVTGGRVPWRAEPRRPGDPAELWADVSRVRRELDWEARYGLDDIVAHAAAWSRAPRY